MRFRRLEEWLAWQETLHPWTVDLGLERCAAVARRLGVDRARCPVITVAGTNGKGSCVAILEAILSAAGAATGAYLSPHLLRYNERVRVRGHDVDDEVLVAAFAAVDAARGAITLTPFEFATLAALRVLGEARVDVALLEVGLGGRLDAVNVVAPDVAVVTNVGLDHLDLLGPDRESIGREKAGILRSGRPAVYGGADPPASVLAHARAIGAPLHRAGVEYRHGADAEGWWFERAGRRLEGLPPLRLPGDAQYANAAAVLAALGVAGEALAAPEAAVRRGLAAAAPLPGRLQRLARAPEVLVDVAHNAEAAAVLARHLAETGGGGRTLAVVAMLRDKDATGTLAAMAPVVDAWHAAPLPGPRGGTAARLAACLGAGATVATHSDVASAWRAARARATRADRLVAFGSFLTAEAVVRLETSSPSPDT